MSFREVFSVTDFRARATELVRRVLASPTERVYVGAHRKPQAVLMSVTADIPADIRETLLGAFFAREADTAIHLLGARRGDFTHIGDSFGAVFAWLWRTNPDEAMLHLAGYLAELRDHHHDAPEPPIRLDDVLVALRMAADITDAEYTAICDRARTDVQKYYSSATDVNS